MYKFLLVSVGIVISLTACNKKMTHNQSNNTNHSAVLATMQKHLNAVSHKDARRLASTLSPSGKMQLILPNSEIIEGVAGFMKFHTDWFESPSWTFETKILNAKAGIQMAMVIVEIIYREPLRDNKPYFNRMIVSYVLEKDDGQWYVIKDHASSVEKSTDHN